MTRFLLATDSVHTTAAACDYLAGRLSAGDAVTAIAVAEPGGDRRDAADALNVVGVRLASTASVETSTADGDAAEAILDAVAEGGVDEIVIGARSGAPGSDVGGSDAGLGDTALSVIARADVPVVVVPLERLD